MPPFNKASYIQADYLKNICNTLILPLYNAQGRYFLS